MVLMKRLTGVIAAVALMLGFAAMASPAANAVPGNSIAFNPPASVTTGDTVSLYAFATFIEMDHLGGVDLELSVDGTVINSWWTPTSPVDLMQDYTFNTPGDYTVEATLVDTDTLTPFLTETRTINVSDPAPILPYTMSVDTPTVSPGGFATWTSDAPGGTPSALFVDGVLDSAFGWSGAPESINWTTVNPVFDTVYTQRIYPDGTNIGTIDANTPFDAEASTTFLAHIAYTMNVDSPTIADGETATFTSDAPASATYAVLVDGVLDTVSAYNGASITMPWSSMNVTTADKTVAVRIYPPTVDVFAIDENTPFDAEATTTFVANAPAPTPDIGSISPGSGSTAGGETVTLGGSGLAGVTSVDFDGSAATIVSTTDTEIVVTTPAHAAGMTDVTVSDGQQTATFVNAYEFVAPIPSITAVTPATGSVLGGESVTITGTDLDAVTSVDFGGTSATIDLVSSTEITVTTPAHAAGIVDVTVVDPFYSTTLNASYEFVPEPVVNPTISGVLPGAGTENGGTDVTITGTGFQAGADVTFGADLGAVVSVTATEIVVTTPAHAAGIVNVTVTNPDTGSDTLAAAYEYTATPIVNPTIISVTPGSGTENGGTVVTITGTGFQAGADVSFGTTLGTVVSVTATEITVNSPVHAVGLVDVTVTNPDSGSDSAAGAYDFVASAPIPVIPDLSLTVPNAATTGNTVTFTGATVGGDAAGTPYALGMTIDNGGAPTVIGYTSGNAFPLSLSPSWTAGAAGTYTVTMQLIDENDNIVSTVTGTITVSATPAPGPGPSPSPSPSPSPAPVTPTTPSGTTTTTTPTTPTVTPTPAPAVKIVTVKFSFTRDGKVKVLGGAKTSTLAGENALFTIVTKDKKLVTKKMITDAKALAKKYGGTYGGINIGKKWDAPRIVAAYATVS